VAMIAPWAYNPVEMSVTATPTLDGGRSGSPVLQTCGYPGHSEGLVRWNVTFGVFSDNVTVVGGPYRSVRKSECGEMI